MIAVKEKLAKSITWVKSHKFITVIVVGVILLLPFLNQGSKTDYQKYAVTRADVIDAVELTGSVSAVDRADLSFQTSGEVVSITAEEGDRVTRGTVLARIDLGTLAGELARAQAMVNSARSGVLSAQAAIDQSQANLDSVRASNSSSLTSVEAAAQNLERVTQEQNQLVENAQRALLTTGLAAYPIDSYRNLPELPVTGNYNSNREGEIIFDFYRSGTGSGYSARYSGLASGTVSFSDFRLPEPIGETGLFVTLPESNFGYTNTDYRLSIPNTRSTSYQTLLNTLESAEETKNRTITAAQNELNRLRSQENNSQSLTSAQERQAQANVSSARAGLGAAQASLAQAQAGVAVIQAQIADRVITAPFSGTIAKTNLQLGETVSVGKTVVTLVSDGDYEIELQVPEIDVARLEPGMNAVVTLDAYNDSVTWEGEVTAIEQIETIVEGVPVYLTTVKILNPDQKIKIGMNARASIELDKTTDVVAVPESYLMKDDNRRYVLVETATGITEKTVKIGLIGADSLVEIISGIDVGETVVKENSDAA